MKQPHPSQICVRIRAVACYYALNTSEIEFEIECYLYACNYQVISLVGLFKRVFEDVFPFVFL